MAYTEFAKAMKMTDIQGIPVLSERTRIITAYALCGFANISSIAVQIGGIGTIAPSRRSELSQLGIKAMCAGALATCFTGAVAGILY